MCFIKLVIVRRRAIIININISLVLTHAFESVLIKRERKKYLLIPICVSTSIKLYWFSLSWFFSLRILEGSFVIWNVRVSLIIIVSEIYSLFVRRFHRYHSRIFPLNHETRTNFRSLWFLADSCSLLIFDIALNKNSFSHQIHTKSDFFFSWE